MESGEVNEAGANPATFTKGMDGEVAYAPIGANQFCFHCRDLKSVIFDLSTLLAFRTFGQGPKDFENLWRWLKVELRNKFF
jgi:hypothetical protein